MLSLQKTPDMLKESILKCYHKMHAEEFVSYIRAFQDKLELARMVASEFQHPPKDRLLTREDVATLIKRDPDTVSDWVSDGIISFLKPGGKVLLFTKNQLLAELNEYRQRKPIKRKEDKTSSPIPEKFRTRQYGRGK